MADRDQTHAPADIDAAVATMLIKVDPVTGEPWFGVALHGVALHCSDDIDMGSADELRHALNRFAQIADTVQGQWLAGREGGGP